MSLFDRDHTTLPDLTITEVIRILSKSVREYKTAALITPLLMIGEVSIECIIPFITAQLINSINAQEGIEAIARYSVILVGLAIVSLACGTIAGIIASHASAGLARNLRHDMFHKIQGFSFANIDRFSTSSLVTRLTTDVSNVQNAFMQLIRTSFRSPLLMVFATVMAFITGGALAAAYVVVAFALGAFLFAIALHVMPIFRRLFRKYDALNESVEENVTGIRVVKAYVREAYEKQKFEEASGNLYTDFLHVERILALNMPFMQFCINVVYAFVIYFGSRAIIQTQGTELAVGQMSALITYGFSILMSLNMLAMIFVMLTMSEEGARRCCEVLLEESDIVTPENPLTELSDGSIDFDNVSFRYNPDDPEQALANIDLHIKSGEVIGIIGGTGSSKTSLVNLISRLYDVTEGSLRVAGHDVREYDLKTLRDQVAVVLQRNVLFSGTIKDNLRWGDPDASDEEMIEACKLAQADEFVQQFAQKYDTYIEQGGTNVSGGQKQRLCIARALLKKPKILILDDSTSAVDTKTDKLIRAGFREFIPETTKLIIAQRTSSVEDADRIIVMDGGRIAAIGTHDELLKSNDIYRETYISQNKQSHDDKIAALEPPVAAAKGGDAQ